MSPRLRVEATLHFEMQGAYVKRVRGTTMYPKDKVTNFFSVLETEWKAHAISSIRLKQKNPHAEYCKLASNVFSGESLD